MPSAMLSQISLCLLLAVSAIQCQYLALSGHSPYGAPTYSRYMNVHGAPSLYASQHGLGTRLGSGFIGNPGIGIRQTGTTLANIYGQPYVQAAPPTPNLSPLELASNGARFGLSGLTAAFSPNYAVLGAGSLINNGYGPLSTSYLG